MAINHIRLSLEKLGQLALKLNFSQWQDFDDFTVYQWYEIAPYINRDGLIYLRLLYKQIQSDTGSIIMYERLKAIQEFKVGRSNPMAGVRGWDPESGALTKAEVKNLYQRIQEPGAVWNTRSHAARILIQAQLELGKRNLQFLMIRADGLLEERHGDDYEYLLRIPLVKAQAGTGELPHSITPELASDIKSFCQRPDVAELQRKYDRLIIWGDANGGDSLISMKSTLSSGDAKGIVQQYIKSLKIENSRGTKPYLHYTATRGRHTVGTHLALDGATIEEIAKTLEHDSTSSSKAYLDAVGEDIVIQKGKEGKLNEVYTELAGAFFKGHIADHLGEKRVMVPIDLEAETLPTVPLIVGSCGYGGPCPTHPFFHCYNGCPDFYAWREGDHAAAKAAVEAQAARWIGAASIPERSSMHAEFDAIRRGIEDVERRIAEGDQ